MSGARSSAVTDSYA